MGGVVVVVIVDGGRGPWRLRKLMTKWPRMTEDEGEQWCWRGHRECGVVLAQNYAKKDQFSKLNSTALVKTERRKRNTSF